MKRNICLCAVLLTLVIFAANLSAMEYAFYPTEDREIQHQYYDDENTIVETDGQALPVISWISSPPHEYQFVCEFDMSSLPVTDVAYAELHFYIEQAFAFDAIRLESWLGQGNGTVEVADYDAGTVLLGTWDWDNPSPGTLDSTIQEHIYLDVTEQINNRTGNLVMINFRLSGDHDDYNGNVFIDSEAHHTMNITASETGTEFSPSLKLYTLPTQDTNAWQMKQKDMQNTGRAAVKIAADRMNDTFFDTIVWQKRSNGNTGEFLGNGMIYYDGVGPGGADVALCSNTWPNAVTCVDRHTGKRFWQDSTTGGDLIGRSTQAFSNNGDTVYATQDFTSTGDRCVAFSTIDGPGTNGANMWGNADDTDPSHFQCFSPTIAPDGRIFLHKWNEKVYAAVDTGTAIQEVWASTESVSTCYSDTALYDNDGTLTVIQTGRAGRISAFDGNTGDQLWQVMTDAGTDASATIDPETGSIYAPIGLNRELYVIGLDIDGNDLWDSRKIMLNDSNNDPNKLEGAWSTGCLSHDGRTFYFQSAGPVTGKLYAINTADGSVKWSYETSSQHLNDHPTSSPIVTENGVIIVGNNYGGQYLAFKDNRTEAVLLDTFDVEASWDDESRLALTSAALSPDGLLYLPLRTFWTASNGDGETPDGQVGYFLTAFDLVGCDAAVPGDLDNNCKVNLGDLAILAENWMTCKVVPSIRCDE